MVKTVTREEIKKILWSIPGEKSPGIDGYGSQFFKDAWNIVGKEVEECVIELFKSGKMLKALNKIIITLIPKETHAESVGDYRPIAYCNTIYKVIYKVLCSRLKESLPTIISPSQSAFVEGRSIVQNISIC